MSAVAYSCFASKLFCVLSECGRLRSQNFCPVAAMRAVLAGVSLTVLADTSRNLWSPQVVSTQQQPYVVPAASNSPLVVYHYDIDELLFIIQK